MNALVTVSARGAGRPARGPAAEVLLLDCSGSMKFPQAKLLAARKAAAAAIEVLPDGVLFAVVAGTDEARMIYPADQELIAANDRTRAEANQRLAGLEADGGTAMGRWLALARDLLAAHPDAVGHALLLTDGQDESESAAALDAVLASCDGLFVCDARGIGDEWEPAELTRIVSALRGSADSALADAELVADFRSLVGAAMVKVIGDVDLRIGVMPYTRLRFVKQVFPDEYDLTDRCRALNASAVALSTGSWSGAQDREYHLCLEFDPTWPVVYGKDRQLGWVQLEPVADARVAADPVPIIGRWTHDPAPATRIHPKVRHYALQAELVEAVHLGGKSYAAGDPAAAEQHWGVAVRLAHELRNGDMGMRLGRLVEIVDAANGQVRLREGMGHSAILAALIGSSISTASTPESTGLAALDCPDGNCPGLSPAGARYCVACGQPL
jgi:hypothetical protein